MKTLFNAANLRGHNQFSWLDSYHSFSFGHFHDPSKMNFGVLRVLNDDTVDHDSGFGAHPHENMEIISIPMQGDLEHSDNMGNRGVIRFGDVQIMSAGTGIQHSEYNNSKTELVKFFQIWVFPAEQGLHPTYDQKTFDPTFRVNRWQTLVDPEGAEGVKIHQNAWFSIAKMDANSALEYQLHGADQGVYALVISGEGKIGEQTIGLRDALGIWETEGFSVEAVKESEVLLIEVPMGSG